MAYAINRALVSPAHYETITTRLKFEPIVARGFRPQGRNQYNRETKEPILFYWDDGYQIHLPYIFASSLFNLIPNVDLAYPPRPFEFTGSLREHQIPVESEAWHHLLQRGTTTLGLYPGYGKTILGAKIASRTQLLTVVLVHREILATQWRTTFTQFTNARTWIVGERNPPADYDVIICMDTRWDQIPASVRNNVGTLIIDEAHAFCTPSHVGCLLAFHPIYIVLESASLERDDGMENMMYAIAGTHSILRESDIPFTVNKIVTNIKPVRKRTRYGELDYTKLVADTLHDERRNQIILDLVAANTNFKILILTARREHAAQLNAAIEQMGISTDYLCGTKRGYQDSNVLVGTTSKIGTGFDPATSCPSYAGRPFDLLILVCSIKKEAAMVQNIGRIFRSEFPIVMHLVDNDDIFKNHWYKARKWYIKRGGVISEHIIPVSDLVPRTPPTLTAIQSQWIQQRTGPKIQGTGPKIPTKISVGPTPKPIKLSMIPSSTGLIPNGLLPNVPSRSTGSIPPGSLPNVPSRSTGSIPPGSLPSVPSRSLKLSIVPPDLSSMPNVGSRSTVSIPPGPLPTGPLPTGPLPNVGSRSPVSIPTGSLPSVPSRSLKLSIVPPDVSSVLPHSTVLGPPPGSRLRLFEDSAPTIRMNRPVSIGTLKIPTIQDTCVPRHIIIPTLPSPQSPPVIVKY